MILGFAHPGLVVPDLEMAREFYERMFGFEVIGTEGWQNDPDIDSAIGLENSSCRGYMMKGYNCFLELFEYQSPQASGPAPIDLHAHEPGIRHLAFYVDDCREEYQRLKENGGIAMGVQAGDEEHGYAVYCRDPFGNIIELAEVPNEKESLRSLPGVNTMFDLKGKNAFITGAADGIGAAVARRYRAAGANVVITDIQDASVLAKEIGAIFMALDVSDEQQVADTLAGAYQQLGKLDVVVNNAGIGEIGSVFEEQDAGVLERVTRINQWGVLYGLKHAPGHMNDGGSIINTASIAAYINMIATGAYSATKAAVVSMTAMSALELGARSIRVNAICPGYIATAMGSGDEGVALCESLTALGRVGTTEDLVGLYHFLASNESSYITGQALKVEGGWSAGPSAAVLKKIIGRPKAS